MGWVRKRRKGKGKKVIEESLQLQESSAHECPFDFCWAMQFKLQHKITLFDVSISASTIKR